ncbi:MAG TPA: hypothetical protein VHZ95_15080, partial [Polyangiales bacterium]|nr:hypothetical protein [Polyangiales bacterium]
RDVTPIAPAPTAQPSVPIAAAAKPAKANVKATMIGQGIGPLIAQQAAAAAPIASANAVESAQHVGYAKTQAFIGAPPPSAAAALHQIAAPDADAFEAPEAARYLPGDPMAPQSAQQPSAARAPRLEREDDTLDQRPTLPGMKDRKLIFVAVGGVVLLSVLLLAFGLMH